MSRSAVDDSIVRSACAIVASLERLKSGWRASSEAPSVLLPKFEPAVGFCARRAPVAESVALGRFSARVCSTR